MYTLRQFRMHTRQAFDDAAEGHEVVISRHEKKYQLIALVNKPLPGHSLESVPGKKAHLKPVVEKIAQIKPDWQPCVHGANPEFCKYSSPGKPCKTKTKSTYVDRDMLP